MGEYQLGVDLGTTYTAAAVRREGVSEIVTLGTRTAATPTIVLAPADGPMVVGEAAERRALEHPERTARQFKRRLGDTAPILLGGSPYSPQALLAAVLADVLERVTAEQGGPPTRVCLAHPANWGPYKRELVRQVAELAGLPASQVLTITEPAAAALHYASQAKLAPGATVAVYDLGGGTFDAAVVRVDAGGAEVLGTPTGVEHLGGIDFDAVVFDHVVRQLGERMAPLLDGDASDGPLLARLREECTRAKEALSTDADTVIGVALPDGYAEVRLTRSELEELLRPALVPTIAALRRAMQSADLAPDDLDGVLLVGGSSRIPLVSELVSAALGRPVLIDAHPKHAVALGAAAEASGAEVGEVVAVVGGDVEGTVEPAARGGRRLAVSAAVVLLVVAGLFGGVLLSGDDEPELIEAASDEGTTTTDDGGGNEGTSLSTSSTLVGETTTSIVTLPGGGTSIVFGPADDGGGSGDGGGLAGEGSTGTTAAAVVVTTAPATTAAPPTFSTPSGVRSARVSNPVVTQRFANQDTVAKTVQVTVSWQAPSNLGGGLSGYRIVGTPLRFGTTPFGTVHDRTVPASQLSASFEINVTDDANDGLQAGGYVRWEVYAVNPAGASVAVRPDFDVPNLIGTQYFDQYRITWALGGTVGNNPNGTCGVPNICSQTPASGTRPNGGLVTYTFDE